MNTSSIAAAITAPTRIANAVPARSLTSAGPDTWSPTHHAEYAPIVMRTPCAKLRTPISP